MTDQTTPSKSVFETTPGLPDPVTVSRLLVELAEHSHAAVRAQTEKMLSGESLPYDPMQMANAWMAFNTALWTDPQRLFEIQTRNLEDWTALWRTMAERAMGQTAEPLIEPARGDRRFKSAAWSDEPVFDYLKQAYLLAAQQIGDLVQTADLDDKTRTQVDFFARQTINALSPANYAMTNPDVVRRTIETGGVNLMTGLSNLLDDLATNDGLVRRRAPQSFEVGKDLAATPGAVVFQNDLFQLIQYAPSTDEVFKRPLLFVPPLVNKFYLFDLTPKASYLKWLVDQGHTVFVISWVNPDKSHADKGLEDYVVDGVLEAIGAVEAATGETGLDLVSYCLGGTLSAMTLAYLAATNQADRVKTATLIATLVDFRSIGEWSVFTGEKELEVFERYLDDKGYVEAHDLSKLFSTVRANDLIWNAVVTHYLLGDESRPSDLLSWFDDGARIPAATLKQYGRLVLNQNRLREPGGIEIKGTPLDLSKVTTPVFVVALKDDHVSAWKDTYSGRFLFGGDTHFILGGSGHNAGMINPPEAGKHGYWTNAERPDDPEAWLAGAENKPGSWWPEWQAWLADDQKVAARTPGKGGKLKTIEAAPGSYVKAR
ncbi:PHA/PHB synthase family protein [Brevundimonas aveniformis]|uniref:PHA/PHB synthase family protein n=1 Tax=Brevundimonas aveniformis TaxID=370977 RepID=UPI002491E131|nr:class I poly(R)-hydroxyalkanoic acid synthase [Brevundimonas aveniformis]